MDDEMSSVRLAQLISAYGADRRRWPEAPAVHGQPAWARTLIRNEAALDALLDAAADELPLALRARILADAPPRPTQIVRRGAPHVWARAATLLVALGAGVTAGYVRVAERGSLAAMEQNLLALGLTQRADPFAFFLEDEA